jgi:hypothetical protein
MFLKFSIRRSLSTTTERPSTIVVCSRTSIIVQRYGMWTDNSSWKYSKRIRNVSSVGLSIFLNIISIAKKDKTTTLSFQEKQTRRSHKRETNQSISPKPPTTSELEESIETLQPSQTVAFSWTTKKKWWPLRCEAQTKISRPLTARISTTWQSKNSKNLYNGKNNFYTCWIRNMTRPKEDRWVIEKDDGNIKISNKIYIKIEVYMDVSVLFFGGMRVLVNSGFGFLSALYFYEFFALCVYA